MKFFKSFLLCTLVFVGAVAMTKQKKTRIVFFGDSITQAAVKPGGYISVIQDSLQKSGLASKYDLVGAGVSGNKIYDLYLRVDDDVIAKNPDVVVIWVGV